MCFLMGHATATGELEILYQKGIFPIYGWIVELLGCLDRYEENFLFLGWTSNKRTHRILSLWYPEKLLQLQPATQQIIKNKSRALKTLAHNLICIKTKWVFCPYNQSSAAAKTWTTTERIMELDDFILHLQLERFF